MYLASEAPKRKFLQGFEDFFWEKCFYFLSGMYPYVMGLISTLDMSKFSSESLQALYKNTTGGLPPMSSSPMALVVHLNKTQVRGEYQIRHAILNSLQKGDQDSAITLHMCFYPPNYTSPENLITSENQCAIEGSLFQSMVTLEQTG